MGLRIWDETPEPPPWFADWIRLHQLLHDDRRWIDPDSDQGMDFYAGWIDAFARNGVTCNEAAAASRQLQSRPPRWGYHLEAILQEIRDKRSVPPVRAKTASTELADARAQSKDCRKCRASGWVRKPMRLASYPYRPFLANFFCSCALGQYRQSRCTDPERLAERDLATWKVATEERRPWDTKLDGPLRERDRKKPAPGASRQTSPGTGAKSHLRRSIPQEQVYTKGKSVIPDPSVPRPESPDREGLKSAPVWIRPETFGSVDRRFLEIFPGI